MNMNMANLNQQTLFAIGRPVNKYVMLAALERLFGGPLTAEMERKYAPCQTIEDVFNLLCRDYFALALRPDKVAEMFCCMCAGIQWTPERDGFDGHGSKLLGFDAAAARVQVRSSNPRDPEKWQFKTIDSTDERRYDILMCVGYRLPVLYRYRTGEISTDHVNPLLAEIFVMPREAVEHVQVIGIARNKYHVQSSGKRANWWEHHVPYWDVEEVVTKLAHGVPPRFDSQLCLLDMIEN